MSRFVEAAKEDRFGAPGQHNGVIGLPSSTLTPGSKASVITDMQPLKSDLLDKHSARLESPFAQSWREPISSALILLRSRRTNVGCAVRHAVFSSASPKFFVRATV